MTEEEVVEEEVGVVGAPVRLPASTVKDRCATKKYVQIPELAERCARTQFHQIHHAITAAAHVLQPLAVIQRMIAPMTV